MDASQYRDYVLVLLFVKYVSDKYANKKDGPLEVPPGGSFADIVALKGDKEIGDKTNKILGKLAEANDLKGVIDVADFNDADKLGRGQEMVHRLSNLVWTFEGIDLGANRAERDEVLGNAYGFLMRHFATESGYTPTEVCDLIADLIGISKARQCDNISVYDPACGAGCLLIAAARKAGFQLHIFGEEPNASSAALARMGMIMHGFLDAEIVVGDALSQPRFLSGHGLRGF